MLPPIEYLLAFVAAASLLTITPGLDTALVLRTMLTDGARQALVTALGICAGCLAWGLAIAAGLGVVLQASRLAYDILRWIGAAYLLYLGATMLMSPRRSFVVEKLPAGHGSAGRGFLRGFLTNALNPKAGIFYVSFLPQFIPAAANPAMSVAFLAAVHGVLGFLWFSLLVLGSRPLRQALTNSAAASLLDRIAGGIFIAFGIRHSPRGERAGIAEIARLPGSLIRPIICRRTGSQPPCRQSGTLRARATGIPKRKPPVCLQARLRRRLFA